MKNILKFIIYIVGFVCMIPLFIFMSLVALYKWELIPFWETADEILQILDKYIEK